MNLIKLRTPLNYLANFKHILLVAAGSLPNLEPHFCRLGLEYLSQGTLTQRWSSSCHSSWLDGEYNQNSAFYNPLIWFNKESLQLLSQFDLILYFCERKQEWLSFWVFACGVRVCEGFLCNVEGWLGNCSSEMQLHMFKCPVVPSSVLQTHIVCKTRNFLKFLFLPSC